MYNITFAQDIVAVLSDDTEVSNVIGYIENNKRYYKTSDNIVLTGDKKVKTIKSCVFKVPGEILPFINSIVNE